uniref:DUF6443 domain-containing protein n=1 Tax=Lambia antarctica TaxID=101717 RepID=A0A1L2EDQ9_9CHLO|nr:hypothetical protein [Lambia antarctica]ANN39012.1 hypothetical protein [Lambia antarctica]
MSSIAQQSNSPGLNFGQLDTQNGSEGTSINLFQGNLSMPAEVISLPGLNSLNCDINLIYQSQVTEKVDQWNLEDSPSFVGLGWDLSLPRIIKDEKSNGSPFDDNFFLIEQSSPTRLIPISKPFEDQIEYELENYAFQRITYFPKLEIWEIHKEDGTIYSYGGQEYSNTLQWGIQWGNWIGPSLITENQERYVKAWNLAKVKNIYGNFYSLSYQVKEQSVSNGILTYTKECTISKIQNDLGWSLNFEYQPMVYGNTSLESPKEYLDPYRDPQLEMTDLNFSDAFQSCYSSIYLESVTLCNQNDQPITIVYLDYFDLINLTPALPQNATPRQRLIYGATYKRYLKSIKRSSPNGESKPGTHFSYNFTTQETEPRGALEKIHYSSGGHSLFNYQKISIGANEQEDPGSRNICILNPFGQDQSAKPRIWYGQDYTISAWYDDQQNKLRLNVFTWVGHWCISQNEWWDFDGVIQLDKLQLAISENCFCLVIPYNPQSSKGDTTDLFFFNRDHLKPTIWSCPDDFSSFETTTLKITNGQNFFLVYDSDNKLMSRYFWHPFQRRFLIENLTISTDSDDNYFITAYSNYYILYRYNASDESLTQFTIDYCDEFYDWQQGSTLNDGIHVPSISSSRYCEFGVSDSFAAVASITRKSSDLTTFNSELKILMWDSDFGNLHFAELEEPWGDGRSPFTYIPAQVMPYLGPMAIQNSLVASGPNSYFFNGQKWVFQTVGIKKDGSNPNNQFYWYAFQRSALLKTENTDSGIYSCLKYPDIEGNDWVEIILDDYSESNQSTRAKENYPTFLGNYLSLDKRVYSNPFNQNWQNIEEYFIEELQVEENLTIDTTTIINQAPSFLAFMTLDENGKPHDTRIGFFRNGDFLRDKQGQIDLEILTGQQVTKLLNKNYHYSSSLNGQLPAIAEGFVTYSIETELDKCNSITLHHYANESLQDSIETFVIQQMTSDSGYNKVSKCYEYENVSAAQDSTQTLIRFQKVTEYQGCLEPKNQTNGYTISYFANGLPSQNIEATIPSALDGVLLKKEQYDHCNNLISFTETESEICTQIPRSWSDSSLRPLFGAFVQTKAKKTMLDGVNTSINFEYLLNSGRVRKTQTSYWDSQGQKVTEQKIFTYGCEKYSELKTQNRLTELIETKIQTKTDQQDEYQTQYTKVQTYKKWQFNTRTYWAEFQEYLATQSNSIFDWAGDINDQENWVCTKTIVQRDFQGNVLQCQDTEKIITSILYDDLGRFPIASFINASIDDGIFYESFEPYQTCSISFEPCIEENEEPSNTPATAKIWNECIKMLGSAWRTISAVSWIKEEVTSEQGGELYNKDCFAGTTCYKMTESGILSKKNIPHQDLCATHYCLSAYLKTNIEEPSQLQFQLTGESSEASKPVTLDSGWFYFQWVVDVTQFKNANNPLNLQFVVTLNQSKNEYVQLDHLSFRPTNTRFSAEIYDPNFFRQKAALGNNGACDRIFYNQFQDQQCMVGAYGNVIGFRTAFLVQQIMQEDETSFPVKNPNMELIIRGQEVGFCETFKENALDNYIYIDSHQDDWCVNQEKLQFLSSAENKILGARVARQSFQSNNLAICVYAPDISAKSISLGIGNFFILWNGTWNLGELQNDLLDILQQNNKIPFGREWIFIFVESRLAFFVNGIKIFDINLPETQIAGSVQLGMQKCGSFEQLFVVDEIEIDINYTDGFGKLIQTLNWESPQSSIIEGTLYDSCGRNSIHLKATRVPTLSFSYLSNWVDENNESLWEGEGIQGDINEYNPDDQGYPFEQEVYETSPLDRVVKKGQPGKDFAITSTNSHIQTIDYLTNTENTDFKYKLPANGYFLQTMTDADGSITHYYRDIAQHLIGVVQEGIDKNRYASWTYDHNGDLIEGIPPNYYSSEMDESGLSTYDYDFLGRQIKSTHPDIGEGNFVYDDAAMVRLYQDAQATTDNIVNYIKYDNLGRILEKGYIEQDWDLQILQAYAKNPKWPENGNWTIRYIYDGDDSTPNMLGNLWQTQTANGNSEFPIMETFGYDLLNCPTTCQRTINNTLMIKLQSTYSCCGILSKTLDNQTNLEMIHLYNPLGKLIQLNGSVDQKTIPSAHYSYTAYGMVQTLKLQNPSCETSFFERDLMYNSPEWLTNIEDSVFKEQLTYTCGGYDNSGYYTGKVASQSIEISEENYGTSCFKVDQWNRLIQSQNSSLDESWEIDLNNNFQTWTSNSITKIFETIKNRNQLLSIQQNDQKATYTYTPSGEIQSICCDNQETQFSYYKGTSCLKTLQICETESSQFEYNGENLRSTKTISSESQIIDQSFYFYNESEKPCLIMQKRGATMKPLRFIRNPFLTILFDGEQPYFALKDHLGSTRVILDISGNICGQYDYSIYGKPKVIQTPPIDYNCLFTDHEYDFESGFYNMEIRLYDPQIGRFLMIDPKAEFFSPYVYVGNNPLIATDPTGRMSSKAIGWMALVLGVIASVATAGLADVFLAPAAAAALGAESALAVGVVTTGVEVVTGSVTGAVASQAVTAGANHEAFFSKSLGTSLLANLAGGAIGAGIGAGVGSAMKAAGSRVSSKAISGTSQGFSKTTKKVGQEVIKEMSNNVSDSLVNSAVNGAFGDDWNGMDPGLVGLSLITGSLPSGIKQYKKVTRVDAEPTLTKGTKIDDSGNPSQSKNRKSSQSNNSTKKSKQSSSTKMTSPTTISQIVRSNGMPKRTKTYSFKHTSNLGTPVGKYTKTHTFAKELHSDAVVSPRH